MSTSLKVTGITALVKDLRKRSAQSQLDAAKTVTKTALDIRTEVIRSIQKGPKTGIIYRRRSVEHQASKEGEAPATDRGTLVSSIYFQQTKALVATIGSRLAYAFYLEFGTLDILPRPSWVPAVEKFRPILRARLRKILKRAFR